MRVMRKNTIHPAWLKNVHLHGFDEEEEEENDSSEDDKEEEEEEDDDTKTNGNDDPAAALKLALRKERRERRKFEREAKQLKKKQETQKSQEEDELTQAKGERDTLRSTNETLANAIVSERIDNEIIKQAGKMRFIDTDDAMQVDRDLIEFDQDEDDPLSVQLDKDSVKDALTDLAKRKPHLLLAEGDENASGGKFNGGRKPNQKETDQERTTREMANYSAMRNFSNKP